jgi:hypothetical protein
MGAVADGEALGAESVPTVGAGVGMKGLTRPGVDAGGVAGSEGGAEEVVAAGGFAGICAGGATEVVEAGGLAGLADGAGEIVTAGGVARVCASAPETTKGRAVSAPANKTRSVMRQDPTQERRASCAPQTIHYAH